MKSWNSSRMSYCALLRGIGCFWPAVVFAIFSLCFCSLPLIPEAETREHIRLYFGAEDSKGNILGSLTEKDFVVKENDKPMSIQSLSFQRNAPISLGILIDISRSMGVEDSKLALQLVKSLAEIMKSPDELFIMAFSEDAELLVDLISPEDYLEEALDHLGTGGPTYTALAMDRGTAKLREARNPRRVLMIFSAGRDKAGPATREHIGRSRLPIYSLQMAGTGGLVGAYDSFGSLNIRGSALKVFADQSGGRVGSGDRFEALFPQLKKFYQEWKNPYLLEYESPNSKQDGKFRKITLEPTSDGVEVLCLQKYFVPLNRHPSKPETQPQP
jgi:Ca-activated chloride channel family protein